MRAIPVGLRVVRRLMLVGRLVMTLAMTGQLGGQEPGSRPKEQQEGQEGVDQAAHSGMVAEGRTK